MIDSQVEVLCRSSPSIVEILYHLGYRKVLTSNSEGLLLYCFLYFRKNFVG
jgi:hypothetical protein